MFQETQQHLAESRRLNADIQQRLRTMVTPTADDTFDMKAGLGRSVEVKRLHDGDDMQILWVHIHAGTKLLDHVHPDSVEYIVIARGNVEVAGTIYAPGDLLVFEKGEVHGAEANMGSYSAVCVMVPPEKEYARKAGAKEAK